MLIFNNAVWDTDVEIALMRLSRDGHAAVLDRDLYQRTADTVAALRDPDDPTQPLTMSALEAWERRCRTAPKEPRHEARPQRTIAPNSVLPDKAA